MRIQPVAATILILVAGLGLVPLTGCRRPRTAEANRTLPTLRVGYVGHDHQLALYVAALGGERYRDTAGAWLREVRPREVYELVDGDDPLARLWMVKVGGASNMPAAMVRDDIQLGLGGLAPVSKFIDKGQPLKVIAPLQTDGDMLVMRSDSPIDTWEEFVAAARSADRPLRIGYKGPTAVAKMVFLRALQEVDLPFSHDPADSDAKVVLVHMIKGPNAIPMLSGSAGPRAIDGFVMNQPVVALAEHKGIGKTIAHLRDLPPAGAWINHPCCVVAATEKTLADHPRAVRALLELIIIATRDIRADPSRAVEAAVAWGGNREVEQRSIPTVTYIADPNDRWLANVRTWARMMQDIGAYKGELADLPAEKVADRVLDLTLCRQAWDQLAKEGRLD
jgi:NitT/TauT family transport system substrate-binding protein